MISNKTQNTCSIRYNAVNCWNNWFKQVELLLCSNLLLWECTTCMSLKSERKLSQQECSNKFWMLKKKFVSFFLQNWYFLFMKIISNTFLENSRFTISRTLVVFLYFWVNCCVNPNQSPCVCMTDCDISNTKILNNSPIFSPK